MTHLELVTRLLSDALDIWWDQLSDPHARLHDDAKQHLQKHVNRYRAALSAERGGTP